MTLLLTHRPDGGAAALYSWTSPDGGLTFGAKKPVGTVPAAEFAAGPGDTLSVVHSNSDGVRYPKLAGGPSGLMLLGSDRQNPFQETTTIIAREFDGTTFGAPVSLLPGS